MRRLVWIPKVLSLSLSLVLSSCSSASAEKGLPSADAATALEAAHVAFVKKDFPEMGRAIKEVMFSDAEPELKQNALKLLDQTYAENCGYQYPVDWRLPPQVVRMRVELGRNAEPDGLWHKTKISGHLKAADDLEQLRLVKHPQTVIADREQGIGDWSLDVNPEDPADIYFELTTYAKKSMDPGLYLLEMRTKDGRTTNGWFILSDQFSSANPLVQSPSVGERFATPRPSFRWSDFKSPEYKTCESRRLTVYVSKIPSNTWDLRWSLGERDPSATSATIGNDGDGRPLEPGQYWFTLSYRESRPFGDLEISRRSATSRHFYVD